MNLSKEKLHSALLALKRRCCVKSHVIVAWRILVMTLLANAISLYADIPQGSRQSATNYYKALSQKLNFSTPDQIFATKLDDVAMYFGYSGLTGQDLQNKPSDVLMNPNLLLGTNSFDNGDILATRFFAPKIINISSLPETTSGRWAGGSLHPVSGASGFIGANKSYSIWHNSFQHFYQARGTAFCFGSQSIGQYASHSGSRGGSFL